MPRSTSLCIADVWSAFGSTADRKWSSSVLVGPLPPRATARPCWLNGTRKRYCAAVPSTNPGPKSVALTLMNVPLVRFGLRNLLAGLRMLRQFCARVAIADAVAESPSAAAYRDSAMSAMLYSSSVPTDPLKLQQPWLVASSGMYPNCFSRLRPGRMLVWLLASLRITDSACDVLKLRAPKA